MKNRDLIWKTSDGKEIKLRNMTTVHLLNSYNFLLKKVDTYKHIYGKKKFKIMKYSFEQEIRLRKLNRIQLEENDQLF